MKENKHTPGPWKLLPGQDLVEIVKPSNGSGHKLIADLSGSPLPQAEIEANAQLIASAPELLGALEAVAPMIGSALGRLRFSVPQDADILTLIRQAIAKAKGQT